MDYERLVIDNLPLLDGVVRTVARRHRLPADEQEELAASVRLKLVENDYEVLRKFEGRCQLRTYLITVVQRHFLDGRIARWGKWRPSAQARRLGPVAVLLDQFLTRDGMSFDEAAAAITARCGDGVSHDELHAMMLRLPTRSPRKFLDDVPLDQLPAAVPSEQDMIRSIEHSRAGDRVERALASALAGLHDEDRLILRLRFVENVRLARIAELVGAQAKPFYRRVEDLMRVLRGALQAQGVGPADITALLDEPGGGVGDVIQRSSGGKSLERPSVP